MDNDVIKAGKEAGQDVRAETLLLLNKSPKTRLKAVIKRLGKLAEAEKTVLIRKYDKEEHSEYVEREMVEDNTTRLNANKFLAELHDAKPSEKHEHSGKLTLEEIIKAQEEEENEK